MLTSYGPRMLIAMITFVQLTNLTLHIRLNRPKRTIMGLKHALVVCCPPVLLHQCLLSGDPAIDVLPAVPSVHWDHGPHPSGWFFIGCYVCLEILQIAHASVQLHKLCLFGNTPDSSCECAASKPRLPRLLPRLRNRAAPPGPAGLSAETRSTRPPQSPLSHRSTCTPCQVTSPIRWQCVRS